MTKILPLATSQVQFPVPVSPLVRVLGPRVNGCNYRGTPSPVTPSDLIRGNVTNEGSGHSRDTGEGEGYSCLDVRYFIHGDCGLGMDFTFTECEKQAHIIAS